MNFADAARRPPPDRILGFLHGSIQNVPKAPSVKNQNILTGGGRRTAAAWSRQKTFVTLPGNVQLEESRRGSPAAWKTKLQGVWEEFLWFELTAKGI